LRAINRATNIPPRAARSSQQRQISGGVDQALLGKANQRFKLVAAGLAFPEMPYAPCVKIFRPFRQKDHFTALGTAIERARLIRLSGTFLKFHWGSSAVAFLSPSRTASQTTVSMVAMKQRH
jgi:hypothetical protein